jgi:hypothetical protein
MISFVPGPTGPVTKLEENNRKQSRPKLEENNLRIFQLGWHGQATKAWQAYAPAGTTGRLVDVMKYLSRARSLALSSITPHLDSTFLLAFDNSHLALALALSVPNKTYVCWPGLCGQHPGILCNTRHVDGALPRQN